MVFLTHLKIRLAVLLDKVLLFVLRTNAMQTIMENAMLLVSRWCERAVLK